MRIPSFDFTKLHNDSKLVGEHLKLLSRITTVIRFGLFPEVGEVETMVGVGGEGGVGAGVGGVGVAVAVRLVVAFAVRVAVEVAVAFEIDIAVDAADVEAEVAVALEVSVEAEIEAAAVECEEVEEGDNAGIEVAIEDIPATGCTVASIPAKF